MSIKHIVTSRNKQSIILALIVFFLGFGVLNVFWLFDSHNNITNGLYDFYAVKYGDSICLPLMVGTANYYTYNKCNSRICKRIKIISGILGIIIGVCIQLSWLFDPDIVINWTIPKAHHFTPAGWYHAFFFVAMLYLFAYYISSIILTNINCSYSIKDDETICYYLFWLSIIIYSYMHFFDDYYNLKIIRIILYLSFSYLFIILLFNYLSLKQMYISRIILIIIIGTIISVVLH